MRWITSFILALLKEVRETAKRPSRIRSIANPRYRRDLIASLRLEIQTEAAPWHEQGGFVHRRYNSRRAYVRHQRAKLGGLDLREYDRRYGALLTDRLRHENHIPAGSSVLCLGARIGTEVKAFRDLGHFAVGIDLNPGSANDLVLQGDFHELPFADRSVDVIFTNSLDHAQEPDRLFAETQRALRAEGLFIAEIQHGADAGFQPGEYESFFWQTTDDVIGLIEQFGFTTIDTLAFEEPWPGLHVTFRSSSNDEEHPSWAA
jgi:SAM-dependent methyltransferase